MTLSVEKLNLTQSGYRVASSLREEMIRFVASGGIFDIDSISSHSDSRKLIAVTKFEDGKLYLRDGLHRVTSVFIARPNMSLFPEEYFIEEMTYEMYMNPSIENGWYTPFDPRVEVRIPDFVKFRDAVDRLVQTKGDVKEFIFNNKHLYSVPRTKFHTLSEVSKEWNLFSC